MNPREFFFLWKWSSFYYLRTKVLFCQILAENGLPAWKVGKGNIRSGIIPANNFVSHPSCRFQRLRGSSLHRYAVSDRGRNKVSRKGLNLRKSKTDNLRVDESVENKENGKENFVALFSTAELSEYITLAQWPSNCCYLSATDNVLWYASSDIWAGLGLPEGFL